MIRCISVNRFLRPWYLTFYFCGEGDANWENPNFAGFDVLDGDDDTLRQNTLVIRIYAKTHTATNYSLLIEYDVALCCLQFIGKDVPLTPQNPFLMFADWTI